MPYNAPTFKPSVWIIAQQRELLAPTSSAAILHGIIARALAPGIVESQPGVGPGEAGMHHKDLPVEHVGQRQPAPTAGEAIEELSPPVAVAVAQLGREAVPQGAWGQLEMARWRPQVEVGSLVVAKIHQHGLWMAHLQGEE